MSKATDQENMGKSWAIPSGGLSSRLVVELSYMVVFIYDH